MNDAVATVNASPFESAGELREANVQLLKELNRRRGRDARGQGEGEALAAMAPQIREFLGRGVATGVYLEDIEERTACQVMVDYWASILSHTGVEVPRERLAAFDGERLPELDDAHCPFVGLEAFSDEKHGYFFGRDKAVADLLARLETTPLVVVQGASGSGKSSLVMGGVLPVLEAPGHAPRLRKIGPFTPGNAPLERLAAAVLGPGADTASAAAALRQDPRHLVTMIGGVEAPA
ncbi:MAG TPA: hypothetical protein VJ608_06035, partial [Albitalea sp.]|nr:hypothetical protein [Albitalea sp.]